jgi:hypothetical protein
LELELIFTLSAISATALSALTTGDEKLAYLFVKKTIKPSDKNSTSLFL